jgi:hypothetical protein
VHEQLVEHEHEHDAEEQHDGVAETPAAGRGKRAAGDDYDGQGALDGDGEEWWRSWRKRIRTEDGYVRLGGEESEADADADPEPDGDGEIDADAEEELLSVRERERERRRKRKRGRGRIFGVMVPEIMGDVPMDVDEIDVENSGVDEEMRILIKVRPVWGVGACVDDLLVFRSWISSWGR